MTSKQLFSIYYTHFFLEGGGTFILYSVKCKQNHTMNLIGAIIYPFSDFGQGNHLLQMV